MAEQVGFGIVGAGLVAPFHLKAIADSDGGKTVAVCDIDRARADKLAAEYGLKAVYSLDDLLAEPGIDVVNVATPNHLHHDAVLACARAGKHVMTEKPPAMSLRETDAMIAACRENGVHFGCFVQSRVRKAMQAMKRAVDGGRFGRMLQADAYMKWFRPADYYKSDAWRSSRKSGAGVTVQQAFHYIDLLQFLVGEAARVEARMTNLAHPDVHLEDTLLAYLTYRNGGQGVVQASTALWPGTDVRIELNGSDGTAVMVGERMVTWQFRDERPEDAEIRTYGDAAQQTGASGAASFGYQDHKVVIQDMIDAVREGRDRIVIPVESVRPTLEIVLAMYQSAARGCTVDLPVTDDDSVWDKGI